jgi:hypothetical protein
MENENTDLDKQLTIDFLRFQVKELESELKKVKGLLANCHQSKLGQTITTIEPLNTRKTIEKPSPKVIKRLSWLGKIVLVLRSEQRPMTATELFEVVDNLDGELGFKQNPRTLFSVVLHKAVKENRLTIHKVKGTRGAYYALKEWTDENGNLKGNLLDTLY